MGTALSTSWASVPPIAMFSPPTPAAYTTALTIFQYFPVCTILQWILAWHPAGKTSLPESLFNIPGRVAWCLMEIVGPLNLLYSLSQTTPSLSELPAPNQLVVALYCIHYANRAVISPFFSAPSMSPIHLFVMVSAMGFNWFNSSCLAGWLSGYEIPIPGFRTNGAEALGSSSVRSESISLVQILPIIGTVLFIIGMAGNIYSETALFQFRRDEAEKRSAKKSDETPANGNNKFHKVYVIPPTKGVFRSILYPHYVFEWLEWTGFALAGVAVFPLSLSTKIGTAASAGIAPPLRPAPWIIPAAWAADRFGLPLPLPAVLFVINAVTNMLPHARWGRKWYLQKFGEKGVAGRGAVVPWCAWM
ncbi:uncharacterized protein N7482_002123 [Penicillium canariense]|uniref:3-oxo-5-alpha-steroid 4-dehydrogenase C-terminal domain-containing protein n=1 Tax=Penicillium canariense TaxID=189055 RepID=A0A9W9IL28_9EURO|nr:uncharacterized protein N7482_002123 [Penicillium canariense]KAJ5176246.1 hypothetical protein N7482_002123 [Penicillium canariense]